MSDLATDRRGVERFNLELSVCISVRQERHTEQLYLVTSNVSSGGAFFNTRSKLPIGTEVEMEMILNPRKIDYQRGQVKVAGKVIRANDTGMAISFNSDYEFSSLFLN